MDQTDGGRHGRVLWGLLSLLCVGGIAGALFLGGRAVARDEAAAAALARTRTVLLLAPLLEPADLSGPVSGARYRELLEAVRRDVIADGPFTALTIWNPSATAVFSTDEAAVGRRAPELRARIDRVARQGVERGVEGEDFETWVPVRLKLDGPVAAVAQFEQPYDELWARANRPWRIAAIGFGVLLLVSGAMLGFTFRPAPGARSRPRRTARPQAPAASPAPAAEGAEDAHEEPVLAAVGGGRAVRRRAKQETAEPPVYAVPGFREQVQAREAAEARAAAAEERAARLRSDFERALAEMRAMQERLRELEGAAKAPAPATPAAAGPGAVAAGPRPDLEAALRRMEQRAEAAERRAERAEAKVAELRGAAERIAGLEAELAEARAGAERAARLEAELAEATDRIRVAEGAVGAARGENQALWERLVQADQRLEEAQAERQALEAKVRELEAALAEAPQPAPDPAIEARLREAEARAEEAERRAEEAERRAAEAERAREEAERRAAASEEALREAQARPATGPADPEAEARARQAEERARLAEERFAEAARQLREAEERAARAQRELEELRARAPAETGGEASELEQALAATQERLRRAGERLQATEERARATERELERVRAQLEEAQAQLRRSKMEEALKALRGDGDPRREARREEARGEGGRPVAEPPLEDRRAAGPFVKALSLEAKNALSAILGVTLALKHTHDPEDQQGLLRKLQAHAKKLDHVVHDLVDADRLARGAVELRRRRTDLDALVRRVIDELDVEAERNVEIASEKLVLSVDPVRVEQIVTALLTGAVNRTGPGSHIWVRVTPEEGGALIAVEDEELSSDAALSPVVLRLADLHGGWARVEGRSTGGSSFQVFLPERAPAGEDEPQALPEPEAQAAAD
ncbi:MAG TPA: hypothetical protein VNP94_12095 [Actinomycetota bacterium]|nr:hypothetical protein [Actinomycetota bacterium]